MKDPFRLGAKLWKSSFFSPPTQKYTSRWSLPVSNRKPQYFHCGGRKASFRITGDENKGLSEHSDLVPLCPDTKHEGLDKYGTSVSAVRRIVCCLTCEEKCTQYGKRISGSGHAPVSAHAQLVGWMRIWNLINLSVACFNCAGEGGRGGGAGGCDWDFALLTLTRAFKSLDVCRNEVKEWAVGCLISCVVVPSEQGLVSIHVN